jgi:hypothetical protein
MIRISSPPRKAPDGPERVALVRVALPFLLSVALASCGGSSNGGGGSGGGGGGGGGSGGFYVSGPAGVDRGGSNQPISFAPAGTTQNSVGLALLAVNPNTSSQSTVAGAGAWLGQATVDQWTAASGTATAVGVRYRVYAGTDGFLHGTDLAIGSSTTGPTTTQLSMLSTSTICAIAPAVLNDYANPVNSVLVLRVPGTQGSIDCGTADDRFAVLPLSAGATTPAPTPGYTEPVDVVRDATGAIGSALLLVHSSTYDGSGNPTGTISVAVATPPTATPTTIGTVSGKGINGGGAARDFQSLAVVPQAAGGPLWLYRDANVIVAVDLAKPGTPVVAYTATDQDVIQGPALVDGTNAYVSTSDSVTGSDDVIRLDTAAITGAIAGSTGSTVSLPGGAVSVLITETATSGLQLLGIAGNWLAYEFGNGSALKAIAKNPPSVPTTPTSIYAAAQGQGLDTMAAPVVVGGGVYYTVSAPSGTPFLQAFYYDAAAGAWTAIGTGASQVLGGVLASPVATASPPAAYGSAVVAVLSAASGPSSIYTGATMGSYAGGATAAATLGTLPTLANDQYSAAVPSEGPLQAGVPALLLLSGNHVEQGSSVPASDLFLFTPGTANSLKAVTNNLQ